MEKGSPPEATRRRGLPGERASASSACDVPAASAKSYLLSYSKVEQDAAQKRALQDLQEKTPSNVRKMISAFETNLAQVFHS